jgi:hypothetical protein
MPETTTALVESPTNNGPTDTVHWWCCNPHIGLCGTDLTNTPEVDDDTDVTCVVCLDLDHQPCPHCGYDPTA